MTGEQPSSPLTTDQKLARIKEYLDEYEHQCGFPDSFNENTINRATDLMNTDFGNFRMTAEECHEASLILSTYANNLQRVINREEATAFWCSEEIKKLAVPFLKTEKAYNHDERMSSAIAQSDISCRLLKHRIDADLRLIHTKSMYFSIKNLSDKFSELGKSLGRYTRN